MIHKTAQTGECIMPRYMFSVYVEAKGYTEAVDKQRLIAQQLHKLPDQTGGYLEGIDWDNDVEQCDEEDV
jgi:hypothetical protein